MAIKIKKGSDDISNYVSTIEWAGSASQCSRTLTLSIANSPYDKAFTQLDLKLGDVIKAYDDGTMFFLGTITSAERSGSIGTVSYTATDFMVHLLNSTGTYKFKNKTPEYITKKICADLNISTGTIIETKYKIPKLITDDEAIYNIMLKAYRKAAKHTGVKYMPSMNGKKVCVIKKGESSGITLSQDSDITSSSYSENIDSMINKVVIYSEKGKRLGTVSNSTWVKSYGIYQATYTKEEGKNVKTAAKNMLVGKDKQASIDAIGDMAALSGRSLKIKDTATGLTGTFWIESDSHTFENGYHTMSLELAFKNVMESAG